MKKIAPFFFALLSLTLSIHTFAAINASLGVSHCDGCDGDDKAMHLPVSLNREVIGTWFNKTFEDGAKVEKMQVQNIKNQSYFVRIGHTAKGDCKISYTPVGAVDYGDTHVIYMMSVGGKTESCTGNGCSNCHLSDFGNGCFCLRGGGTCDHTIIKTKLMLR